MKILLSHGATLGWRLLAEIIIVLAILLSLSRLILPFANEFRDVAAEEIGKLIRHPVSIGLIEADWAGFKPLIKLRDVRIDAPDGSAPLATFELIRLKINPWRSLARGALVPDKLILRGSVVEIVRRKDGRLLFRGFEPAGGSAARRFNSLEELAGLTLDLRDIRVIWEDQALNRKFRFVARKLRLVIGSASVDLDAHIDLPYSQGENLRLIARARGPLNDVFAWRGDFYLKGSAIDVRGNPLGWPTGWPRLSNGRVNVQTWGNWRARERLEAIGEIAGYGLRIEEPGSQGEPRRVSKISSRFHLTGEPERWRLDLDRLALRTGKQPWPASGLSLAWTRAGEGGPVLTGFIDRVNIGELAAFAAGFSRLPAHTLLERLAPEGQLTAVEFRAPLKKSANPRYRFSAKLDGVGWAAYRRWPGVRNLSGRVRLDEQGGRAVLNGQRMVLDLPKLLGHALPLDSLSGEADWRRGKGGSWEVVIDKLRLATGDFTASGAANVTLAPDRKPVLDLELMVPRADAKKAPDYIPFPVIRNPRVRELLRKGFIAGTVRNALVSYHGALDKQALRSGKARLRAAFDVENARFHYHDGWPDARELNGRVRFANARFDARVDRGRILETRVSPATLKIANLFRSRLDIEGKARGDLSDVIRFLHDTPLVKNMTAFLGQVESRGDTRLSLSVQLPLGKALKRRGDKPKFNGHVLLEDALLALPRQNVRFEGVTGSVAFSDKSWDAIGLSARFRGSPVTGRIGSTDNGDIQVNVEGDYDPAALLPNLRRQLALALPGRGLWRGTMTIPSRANREQGEELNLVVRSDLRGVAIALPPPLEKPATESAGMLTVDYRFSKPPRLKVSYGQTLQFEGELKTGEGNVGGVERGVVRLLDTQAPIPEQGLLVAGDWPGVALGPWLDALDRLRDPDASGPEPVRLDAGFGYVSVGDSLTLNHLRVVGEREDARWFLKVRSDQMAGTLNIPMQRENGARIRARLTRLALPTAKGGDKSPIGSPLDLPSVDAEVESLSIGDRALGKARLLTTRVPTGLRIDRLDVDQSHLKARSGGGWYQSNGHQRLELNVNIASDDVGASLADLGVRQSLQSGHGDL
ncbi:MAG TPA: hypothetical protein ENK26_14115, partial [Gammaproteobacteria bacterium]|nr:hypothetical protein [Gammaproteobacteria bacterium]